MTIVVFGVHRSRYGRETFVPLLSTASKAEAKALVNARRNDFDDFWLTFFKDDGTFVEDIFLLDGGFL